MNIGFIGLGIMGKPMALNLIKAGYRLKVYDISNKATEEVVAAGAEAGNSSGDVASSAIRHKLPPTGTRFSVVKLSSAFASVESSVSEPE